MAPPAFLRTISLLLVLGGCAPSILRADAIHAHYGDLDPLTEGWFSPAPVAGTVTWGPTVSEAIPAWFINDADTIPNSAKNYRFNPSSTEEAFGFAYGWSMEMQAQVVNQPDDPINGSIVFGMVFARGTHGEGYAFSLGAAEDGDPIMVLTVGTGELVSYVLEGFGPGFHTYLLDYDPVQGDVDVSVDNTLLNGSYGGFIHTAYTEPLSVVEWGSGSSADTGHANYSEVLVTFVPEGQTWPASVLLPLLACWGWRRKRTASSRSDAGPENLASAHNRR